MKESLSLIGTISSVLDDFSLNNKLKKSDDELMTEANTILNLPDKINFFKNNLRKNTIGYIKSKRYLADLLKSSDPKYACELIMSVCCSSPIDPLNYLLFSEVAIEHKAWLIAKSGLEIVKWLTLESNKDILKKTESLNSLVLQKIQSSELDNSNNQFWFNKAPDKYWILKRLYYQSKTEKLIELSFKLLDTFSMDEKNYEIVCRVLALASKKESLNKFIDYVSRNFISNKICLNQYLGMANHYLLNVDLSISQLVEVVKIEPANANALFYLALNYLYKNNLKDFVLTCSKIIPVSEPSFIALYFIYSAISEFSMDKTEFPNGKNISQEVSIIFDQILKNKQIELANHLISQFKKLDYYLILPYLPLYLAEVLIKHNRINDARKVLEGSKDSEVHRLYAWIYRLEGKDDLAEKELAEYRKHWLPNKDSGVFCQTIDLDLPKEVPNDLSEIFKILKNAYKKTKDLIYQFDLEYGINAMTCMENACQECCKKTFPYVSYTEYLYMKSWLEKQDVEYQKKIYEDSVRIVNIYLEKYKKDPPFLCGDTFDQRKEYPLDFIFECPYLGDNKCNVYEASPFTCRAYGYTSEDGVKFKGCSYFYNQLKGATKLTDVRKVISMTSFFDFAKLADEKLIGKRVIAPIPVWFAQSHDETLEKIKKYINS